MKPTRREILGFVGVATFSSCVGGVVVYLLAWILLGDESVAVRTTVTLLPVLFVTGLAPQIAAHRKRWIRK